jgi:hypothetical protein
LITILWPLLIAIIGFVIYLVSTNPKVAEAGRVLLFVGAFWTVAILAGSSASFG